MVTASKDTKASADRGGRAGTDRNELFQRPCGDRDQLSQCMSKASSNTP